MTKTRTDAGLAAAILVAGSVKRLAKMLKIGSSAISQWERTPHQHVLAIEKATGVSRHKLRPDLHGARPPRPSN